MPWSRAASRSSWWSRRARMPPWIAGCRVLTRPSIISGKPVTSETGITARPASLSARAVPPVETSSKPRAARPRPRSTMPVLSETLSIALGIWVKVQYYHFDAGRAWRRKGKAAQDAAFFFGPLSLFTDALVPQGRVVRHSKQEQNDAYYRQGQVVQQRQGVWVHRA